MLTTTGYALHMLDMAREPADWRDYMNDQEREELALAERVRDAAAEQLRVLTRRLKSRCIMRMKRSKSDR
jgi:hypothetical protein